MPKDIPVLAFDPDGKPLEEQPVKRPTIRYKSTPPHMLAPPDNPGSKPLHRARHEHYCRLRAQLLPRWRAYAQAYDLGDDISLASGGASKLERKRFIHDRIAYLQGKDAETIRNKQQQLEQFLWSVHEVDPIAAFDNNCLKPLDHIPAEIRLCLENVAVDSDGKPIGVKFHSKLAANAELRKMLGLDKPVQQPQTELDRMSDADLVNELAKQANELGVKIDLSYKFGEGD